MGSDDDGAVQRGQEAFAREDAKDVGACFEQVTLKVLQWKRDEKFFAFVFVFLFYASRFDVKFQFYRYILNLKYPYCKKCTGKS